MLVESASKMRSDSEISDPHGSKKLNIPSDMPTEHTAMIYRKYAEYQNEKQAKKSKASEEAELMKDDYPQPESGISPRKIGLKREEWRSKVDLTKQVTKTSIAVGSCHQITPSCDQISLYLDY